MVNLIDFVLIHELSYFVFISKDLQTYQRYSLLV
jgi:hypothetical protein